jgi:Protein of unknown function (DUF3105)
VPTRKEERERLRAEREAAERQAQQETRRRLMVGYVVAGVLGLALVVGVGVALFAGGDEGSEVACAAAHVDVANSGGSLLDVEPDCREGTPPPPIQQGDLERAAEAANCKLEVNLPNEGNTHISDESQIPDYATSPPTSGNHNPVWQSDGAYRVMPEPWHFVHSLEHGRVEIQYSPDLPERDQLALKGVFDESPSGVLLFPNPDMPYEVAVTGWTKLMGCETYEGEATLDAIRDFRDVYRGDAPEGDLFPINP